MDIGNIDKLCLFRTCKFGTRIYLLKAIPQCREFINQQKIIIIIIKAVKIYCLLVSSICFTGSALCYYSENLLSVFQFLFCRVGFSILGKFDRLAAVVVISQRNYGIFAGSAYNNSSNDIFGRID
jgi:hypothetical protein